MRLKTPTSAASLRQVSDAFTGPLRVLVATHARPDGDANGSQAALCRLLASRSAAVAAVVEGPDLLGPTGFLLDSVTCMTVADALRHTWDVVVLLDCATLERAPTGLSEFLHAHPRLVIVDHHVTHESPGFLSWVESDSSSTGELIARIAFAAGWPLDRDTAEALWVAMVTDTGRFTFANTQARTLRVAARLLSAAPVRTEWLFDRVYSLPLRTMRLRSRALASLDVWHDGRMAVVCLAPEDFSATGCTVNDLESIIDLPRSLSGASAAALLHQAAVDGPTRMSLRSRPPLDAARFCAAFGGGGHVRAAGCSFAMPLAAAVEQLRRATRSWLAECPAIRHFQ